MLFSPNMDWKECWRVRAGQIFCKALITQTFQKLNEHLAEKLECYFNVVLRIEQLVATDTPPSL